MAAYLRTWADVEEWMQDNSISRYNVSRSRESQNNDFVFFYDKELSAEENKLRCERALQRFAGDMLYLVGWRSESAKTGGFSASVLYDRVTQTAPTVTPTTQVSGVGLYGTDNINIEMLRKDIALQIHNEYERERLERLDKELREERRDFEAERNSAIGILAQYLAPLVGRLNPMKNVAGVPLDAAAPVEAEPIRVKHEQAQETDEPVTETEEEIEIFCSEKEYRLMLSYIERLASVEPQWLQLLQKVAELAESGDNTYTMAKQFLLNK